MRKDKFYKYNESTLSYDKYQYSLKERLIDASKFLGLVIATSSLLVFVTRTYFPSAQERALVREIEQMELKYSTFNQDLVMMEKVLLNLHERDGAAHRMTFGMDPIDGDVWSGGVGGHRPSSDIINYEKSGLLLSNTQRKID